jgi:hypothetical protein
VPLPRTRPSSLLSFLTTNDLWPSCFDFTFSLKIHRTLPLPCLPITSTTRPAPPLTTISCSRRPSLPSPQCLRSDLLVRTTRFLPLPESPRSHFLPRTHPSCFFLFPPVPTTRSSPTSLTSVSDQLSSILTLSNPSFSNLAASNLAASNSSSSLEFPSACKSECADLVQVVDACKAKNSSGCLEVCTAQGWKEVRAFLSVVYMDPSYDVLIPRPGDADNLFVAVITSSVAA